MCVVDYFFSVQENTAKLLFRFRRKPYNSSIKVSEIQFSLSAQCRRDGKLPLDFSFKLLSELAKRRRGGGEAQDWCFPLIFFLFQFSSLYHCHLDQNSHEQHKTSAFAELEQNPGRTLPTFAGFLRWVASINHSLLALLPQLAPVIKSAMCFLEQGFSSFIFFVGCRVLWTHWTLVGACATSWNINNNVKGLCYCIIIWLTFLKVFFFSGFDRRYV